MRRLLLLSFLGALSLHPLGAVPDPLVPGSRVLLDAHNAYPEVGRFADRVDRALSTGTPLAIEQDLFWYRDPVTGAARSLLNHVQPAAGNEPGMREYFFERVRPIVERAIQENRRDEWPIITLNLDFKSDEPEHHAAVWALLGEYEAWLCTAPRGSGGTEVLPLKIGPVLVLTGEQDTQQRDFFDTLTPDATLRLFGAVHRLPTGGPGPKTNYRRWWNNSWSQIEPEGQPKAGAWSPEDEARLTTAVQAAHAAGLWIRYYTLDGYDPTDLSGGWGASYNFGSMEAVRTRWRAAIRAGVDFVAVNQYEAFARELHNAAGGR